MNRFLSLILIIAIFFGVCTVESNALGIYDISAKSAVVMCVETGEVLFAKNEHQRRSMASTTKIMTTLLALEQYTPGRQITVTESMIKVEGTSMGLLPGDTVTMQGLAYGMMLPSGNDAANVVAITLGGNVKDFAQMMNARAKQIGMDNTNFVTPSGLDDEEHYSTAYDMALLGCEAIKNPLFKKICSTQKASVYYGNPPYKRTLSNHNRLLKSYEGAIGMKTGFTKKSGRCLVSCAERDGVTLVAVTLSAPDDWQDHKKMLDYGFSKVEYAKADFDENQVFVPVVGGTADSVGIECEGFTVFGKSNDVKHILLLEKFLYAPVLKGDVVGKIIFKNGNEELGVVPLVAKEDVRRN